MSYVIVTNIREKLYFKIVSDRVIFLQVFHLTVKMYYPIVARNHNILAILQGKLQICFCFLRSNKKCNKNK